MILRPSRLLVTVLAVLSATLGVNALHVRSSERAQSSGAGQSRDERIHLAILRADGILLPFAAFHRGNWSVSWPADLTSRELPANVAAIPRDWWGGSEPASWRLFPQGAEAARPLRLVSPVMIPLGMSVRLGLRTDHPAIKLNVPPNVMAFPKIGLAIAGDVDLRPIKGNNRKDPASGEFLAVIRQSLNDAEEQTIAALRRNTGWQHPIDKKLRTSLEPEAEAWYSTTLAESSARVSYFEVVKKYPLQAKDEGCGLETFLSGWVIQTERQDRPKTEIKASVVYCDRARASYMLPLGQLTVRDRVYWVFQMSGYDHEWYAVAELTASKVRIAAEYFAGGYPMQSRQSP